MSYSNNLGSYLLSTYPNATPDVDYVIEAYAGQGPTIIHWADSLGAQPDPAVVSAWTPTSNLTDVEIATANFRNARLAAPAALDSLKGAVWAGLVASGLAPDEATAAGVGLVLLHGPLLAAFEAAGGHPVAGAALYAAIASPESVAALPWLKPEVLAIFAAALTPEAK